MRHIGGRDDDIPGMPGNTFIAHDEFRDSFAQHPGFRVGMGMQAGPFPRCRVALGGFCLNLCGAVAAFGL